MIFGIYQYLKEYLYWVRNVKLVESKEYLNTRKECVNKLLKCYSKKYPERSCIQQGGRPILRGGSEYEELNKIYNMIQSIDPNKIKGIGTTSQELDEIIKKLQSKIKEVATTDVSANLSSAVQNSIEVMMVGLKKFKDVDKIQVAKLEKTLPNELSPEFQPVKIEDEIGKMKDKLKQLSGDKADVNKFKDAVQKLDVEVVKYIDDYKLKIKLIRDAIEKMRIRICELNSSTKYDEKTKLKELVYVPLFRGGNDNFLAEIGKITDAELNKFLSSIVPKLLEVNSDKKLYEINLRDAVQMFNDGVAPYTHIIREKTKYKNFIKYYDGENNTRINNKFFSKEGIVDIKMINDMIFDPKFSLENVHKDIISFPTEYIKKLEAKEPVSEGMQTAKIDEIKPVKPQQVFVTKAQVKSQQLDVKEMPKGIQARQLQKPTEQKKVVASVTKKVTTLKGGENELGISTERYESLAGILNQYNIMVEKYNDVLSMLNSTLIDHFMHNVFLVAIATNQLISPGFVIHEYIQRGALALYRRIINNLMDDIEKNPMKIHCIYMRKYHTITLKVLQSFVNKVTIELNKLKLEHKRDFVIDINSCTGVNRTGFLLLNHFKELLMQYNALAGSKVTIYGRVNDLGESANPSVEKELNTMTYLSGFDLEMAKNLLPEAYTEEQATKKEILKIDKPKLIACENEEILSDLQSGPDVRKMWIKPNTCKCESNSSGLNFDVNMKPLKFTEVFDSNQYPKSDDISKYMQVETLLAQGRGVGMMTYGYSGTGKTFTLFGNSASNISGILQSTLSDVNGLKAVNFRAFELYGLGMPYPHYWMKDIDKCIGKEGCLPNISHYICHYNTYLDNELGLVLDSRPDPNNNNKLSLDTRQMPDKFGEYVNDKTKTYCSIPENMISKTFRIFENYIEAVDKYRIKTGRIRDTPNNPVSSRSVVIYDFQLDVYGQDKKVPFLIVDLPGREEILQTFVEPYLNSDIIKNILTKANAYDNRLKLTLAFACINPLGLSTVESGIILDEIKKMKPDDRAILFGDKKLEIPLGRTTYENLLAKIVKEQSNPNQSIKQIYRSLYDKLKNGTLVVNDENLVGSVSLLEEFINMDGGVVGKWFSFDNATGIFKIDEKASGFGYEVSEQFQIVLCMHIINRLILNNRFDILFNITKKIIHERINKHIDAYVDAMEMSDLQKFAVDLVNGNFKLVFWKNKIFASPPSDKPTELIIKQDLLADPNNLKKEIKNVLYYDYISAPYEGFYINENIIGLIKYLAQTANDDPTFVNKQIPKQNPLLDFTFQRNKIRIMEITKKPTNDEIKTKFIWAEKMNVPDDEDASIIKEIALPLPEPMFNVVDKKLVLNTSMVDKIYKDMLNSYRSERIFNFDYPVIGTILKPYLSGIFDYKVLYLLANYKDDKKRCSRCEHQYKLLTKTVGFINAIA